MDPQGLLPLARHVVSVIKAPYLFAVSPSLLQATLKGKVGGGGVKAASAALMLTQEFDLD